MVDSTASIAAPTIDSARLASAISPTDGGGLRLLHAFWLMQPGRWYEWVGIWTLQNLRFAPIYILPLLTGRLIDAIDRAHPEKVYSWMPLIAGTTIGLCVVNIFGDTVSRILQSRIARGLTAGLRDALMRRLNRLSLEFHDRERLGQLETRFTLDMNRLEGFLGFFSEAVLMNVTVLIVMSVIIARTDAVLLIVIALGATLNLILARALWARLRGAQESYRRAEGSFIHRLGETLRGVRITRAHATESFSEERMRTEAREVARRGMTLDLLINFFGSSSWAIGTILSTAVVLFGVWLVVVPPVTLGHGGWAMVIKPITLGQMTVLLSYYGIMAGALSSIVNQLPTISSAHDAMRSLSTLYREEVDAVIGGEDPGQVTGAISLHEVGFAYTRTDQWVLDGLSLTIPAGSSIALVGPSGGGKTTIASLILGFYRPQVGRIEIDGRDLANLDLRALRSQVGVVNQELTLFNDTLLGNIAWGDRIPDEARALEAARMANAMEFIDDFPDGLYHVLGDHGSGLSGGQRQRLAIARALYRNPRILILDEATSALDTASERLVQEALTKAMHGRTAIIIAHRLSTIRGVDRVAVIADGAVAELGTYAELVALDGIFARMVEPEAVATA